MPEDSSIPIDSGLETRSIVLENQHHQIWTVLRLEVLPYHASNVVLEREFGIVRLEAGCVRRGSSGTQAVKSRVRFTSDIAADRS